MFNNLMNSIADHAILLVVLCFIALVIIGLMAIVEKQVDKRIWQPREKAEKQKRAAAHYTMGTYKSIHD